MTEPNQFLSANKGYVTFLEVTPGTPSADQLAGLIVQQRYGIRWATVVQVATDTYHVLVAVVTGTMGSIDSLATSIEALGGGGNTVRRMPVKNGECYKLSAGVLDVVPHNGWP